jgi:hypothetical protein
MLSLWYLRRLESEGVNRSAQGGSASLRWCLRFAFLDACLTVLCWRIAEANKCFELYAWHSQIPPPSFDLWCHTLGWPLAIGYYAGPLLFIGSLITAYAVWLWPKP